MGSSALNDAERNTIVRMFGPNCNVKGSAMVRLYVTPPNGIVWKFTNIIGVLALMNDNNMKGHFLRIVDIKNMKITFEQEIYEFFEYKNPRTWFHTFESDNVVHGLSFANEPEAKQLFDLVCTIVNTINGPNAAPMRPRTTTAPQFVSQTSFGNLNAATSTPTSIPSTATTADSKKKKKKEKKEKKKKKGEEHVMEISGPMDFKHESHIGWDAQKGFEIRNIPPEWKKLFQQAGIRKSELRDKETANMLMTIVGAQLGVAAPAGLPPGPPPGPPGPPPGPPHPGMANGPPHPGMANGKPPPGMANRASMVRSSSDMGVGRAPPGPPGERMSRMPPPPPGGFAPPPPPPSGFAPPPPPPPPAGGPPPPPPPMMAKSMSSPSLTASDSRSDLLSAIRGGTQLRKVEEQALPDISTLPESESKSIVDTLALAIQARRLNIREGEDEEDDEDEDEDDEWSD